MNTGSHSLASLAHSALKTMGGAFATSSASRYEHNWTRFVTFVKQLDRNRRYLPVSRNTIIVCVHYLKKQKKKQREGMITVTQWFMYFDIVP